MNLRKFNTTKRIARQYGKEGEIIDRIPPCYYNGHIAELAFFGMMGYLQSYMIEKRVLFRVDCSEELDLNDIDCMINRFPLQIKSHYGRYASISTNSYVHTLWLSYDNRELTLSNIKEVLEDKIKIEVPIPETVYRRMMHIWDEYMIKFNII